MTVGSEALVLGADVGGTNTKIALAALGGARPLVLDQHVFKSRDHASLDNVVQAFLLRPQVADVAKRIRTACFAVAGPVEHGRARLTNLPWQPDERELAARFELSAVRIINDFAAAGRGVEHLRPDDLLTLQTGANEERGDRVVVGAGTGLGVALLEWDDGGYEVHSTEAGHTDFAPVDGAQDELLRHLRQEFGRVSWERVLSGAGLVRLLEYVEHTGPTPASQALTVAMQQGDPAGAISRFALDGSDEAAARALDIFVAAYGSFAGNMALVSLAHGGVYIAGGIAPKIAAKLRDGAFMRAFADKGRLRTVLDALPVHVVMNEHIGLIGALAEAARIAR